MAESLLPTELKGGPRACPHKVSTSRKFSATSSSELSASCAQEGGCTAVLGPGQRSRHAAACLFRPVGAGTRARGAPKQVLSSRFGHVRPEFDLVIKFCGWSTPILHSMVLQVRCPKAMFSSSCVYKGPYCTIQVREVEVQWNGTVPPPCHPTPGPRALGARPPQGGHRHPARPHHLQDVRQGDFSTQLFLAAYLCSLSLRPAPEACY